MGNSIGEEGTSTGVRPMGWDGQETNVDVGGRGTQG